MCSVSWVLPSHLRSYVLHPWILSCLRSCGLYPGFYPVVCAHVFCILGLCVYIYVFFFVLGRVACVHVFCILGTTQSFALRYSESLAFELFDLMCSASWVLPSCFHSRVQNPWLVCSGPLALFTGLKTHQIQNDQISAACSPICIKPKCTSIFVPRETLSCRLKTGLSKLFLPFYRGEKHSKFCLKMTKSWLLVVQFASNPRRQLFLN